MPIVIVNIDMSIPHKHNGGCDYNRCSDVYDIMLWPLEDIAANEDWHASTDPKEIIEKCPYCIARKALKHIYGEE